MLVASLDMLFSDVDLSEYYFSEVRRLLAHVFVVSISVVKINLFDVYRVEPHFGVGCMLFAGWYWGVMRMNITKRDVSGR